VTEPRMRAGTSDRQAAVDKLTGHFTDGRLEPDEFDDRVGKAYAAKHLDELPELFVDLPENQPKQLGGGRPGPGAGFGHFGPPVGPGHWQGPVRPPFHRPPRILGVLVLLAVLFSIGAMSHGFFPFPLIWLGVVLLLIVKGGHRRRWAQQHGYQQRRYADDGCRRY